MTRAPVAWFRQVAGVLLCVLPGGDWSPPSLTASPPASVTVKLFGARGPAIGVTVKAIDQNGNSVLASPVVTDAGGTATITPMPGTTLKALWVGGPGCVAEEIVAPFGPTVTLGMDCGDAIVTGVPEDAIAFVDYLSAASGSPTCVNDGLVTGFGRLAFSTNVLKSGDSPSGCHGAIGVLSKDRAFWFANDESSMAWTEGYGDQVLVSLPTGRLAVPIKIYLSDTLMTAAAKAAERILINSYITNAEGTLRQNYTGLRLQLITAPDGTNIEDVPHSLVATLGKTCETAAQMVNGSSTTALYDVGRINVFFVPKIGDSDKAGFTCTASGYPNIIFVTESPHPYTLVHEVGHALGLIRPYWGHTFGLVGFSHDNLMDETSDGDKYLSVGQVAQMNLSTRSWLNLPSATDGTTLRGRAGIGTLTVVPCGCPENVATTYCPALSLDLPRVGLLAGPPSAVANCIVEFMQPTIDLACSPQTPTDVTATFTPGASASTNDDVVWMSLTPTIVSAAVKPAASQAWNKIGSADSSAGTVTARGVAGTGIVRVWAQGTYADLTVHVHC